MSHISFAQRSSNFNQFQNKRSRTNKMRPSQKHQCRNDGPSGKLVDPSNSCASATRNFVRRLTSGITVTQRSAKGGLSSSSQGGASSTRLNQETASSASAVPFRRSCSFDFLSYGPPVHAFPTAYPPQCPEDPFPCRFGDTSYCKTKLDRRKSTKGGYLQKQIDCDVSSLITTFENLSIRKESANCSGDNINHPADAIAISEGCDVMSPYTTRPFRAPLHSLIKREKVQLALGRSTPLTALLHVTGDKPNSSKAHAEERRQESLDFTSHNTNIQVDVLSGVKHVLDNLLSAFPTDPDDLLPSLSYSSSSSVTSDSDDQSQYSPCLSFVDQDFLSPSCLCTGLPFVAPLMYADKDHELSDLLPTALQMTGDFL